MKYEAYRREINLIKQQNWIEYDLYSIVASVMRDRENIKEFSLRDISKRRRGKKRNGNESIFYGLGGFPDFAILSTEFNRANPNNKDVLGVIEIKNVGEKLININENPQLMGHILWFSKVIYTNGVQWKYYEYFPDEDRLKDIIALQKKVYELPASSDYKWEEDKNNKKLLEPLLNINPIWSQNEDNWDFKDWEKLIINLSEIEWET